MRLPPAEILQIELEEACEDRRRMALVPIAMGLLAIFGVVLWWMYR